MAEQAKNEALMNVQLITEKLNNSNQQNGPTIPRDLKGMSIQKLKGLQVRLFSIFFFIYFLFLHC